MAYPDTTPATTPMKAKPNSSRGSLHVENGAASSACPPSSAFSTTAADTAPTITPPRTPRSALPRISSSAKTTPVIGVLKIAAMPAATPTGIMPRTSFRGMCSSLAMAIDAPLVTTTIGPSGPSGAPAPREIGVARNVAPTLRGPSSDGSVL